MRSSTFDSDTGHLAGPWLKTWVLATALAVTCLLGWEVTLRRWGYRPTVIDDKALWASERDRAYSDCCGEALVLLGDCRMQLDVVPRILQECFPRYRPVQLAVEETSPVAVLRDLAADESFRGTVICALNARLMCRDMWDSQQPYVDYYHEQFTLNEKLDRLFSALVQRTFVLAHPYLRLDELLHDLVKDGRLRSPYYIETHVDRSRLADYSMVDLAAHRAWAVGRATWLCVDRDLPSASTWLADAMELEEAVRTIQCRGGRVVFVHLPTSGEHLTFDELAFPKAQYWDAFAAKTSALCLHFQDLPQLSDFECPDTSHLDRRDAPRFTRALAGVLQDQGVLTDSPCTPAAAHIAEARAKCHCPHGVRHLIAWARCLCCRVRERDLSRHVAGRERSGHS